MFYDAHSSYIISTRCTNLCHRIIWYNRRYFTWQISRLPRRKRSVSISDEREDFFMTFGTCAIVNEEEYMWRVYRKSRDRKAKVSRLSCNLHAARCRKFRWPSVTDLSPSAWSMPHGVTSMEMRWASVSNSEGWHMNCETLLDRAILTKIDDLTIPQGRLSTLLRDNLHHRQHEDPLRAARHREQTWV